MAYLYEIKDVAPDGYVTIGAIIKDWEKDPERLTQLNKAREWLDTGDRHRSTFVD